MGQIHLKIIEGFQTVGAAPIAPLQGVDRLADPFSQIAVRLAAGAAFGAPAGGLRGDAVTFELGAARVGHPSEVTAKS